MKVLVSYNDELYLVPQKNKEDDFMQALHEIVNEGLWPDERHPEDTMGESIKVICYLNDEAEFKH